MGLKQSLLLLQFRLLFLKQIIYEDLPVDDPKVRQPDISKAKRVLGWEPKVKRSEGLKKTMEYFKLKIEAVERLLNGYISFLRKNL